MPVRIKPYGLVLRYNQWFIISITEGEYPSTCVEMLSIDGRPAYQYYMVSEFMKVENTGEKFIQNKYFKLHKAISMAPELRRFKSEEAKKEITLIANNKALAKIQSQTRFFYNAIEGESDKTKVTLYSFGKENVIDYILSLGADVEVLSPNDVRDCVREKIMEMCQVYFDYVI